MNVERLGALALAPTTQAMGASDPICNRRFSAAGIPQTEAARQAYRRLLLTSSGLGCGIDGVILCDGTSGSE